jgi:hypothetical protein
VQGAIKALRQMEMLTQPREQPCEFRRNPATDSDLMPARVPI